MRGGGSGGALRPAARRRERSGNPDADGNRIGVEYSGDDQEGERGRAPADGLWASRLQELRSAREDSQGDGGAGVRGDGAQSADRYRAGARANRAAGRLFHQPQVVSQRGFLFGDYLPGDGVPGAVRDTADVGMDGAMGRDGARSRAENRAAAADLHRRIDSALHCASIAAEADAARRCGERSYLTIVRFSQGRLAEAVGNCAIHGWPRRNSLLSVVRHFSYRKECTICKEAVLRWARMEAASQLTLSCR